METIKRFTINNELGIHARTAAMIVELAKNFNSKLYIKKNDEEVDGRSILSILTLSCPRGSEIQVRIVGEDSKEFMDALTELIENGFGED